jgi:NTE family protein
MNQKQVKTVSLILGSGGARGLAHIGVIQELLSSEYQIQSICGCSMGALVGGVFAAGKMDEFESWVRAIRKRDVISLLDIAWDKNGLVKGDKIINTLIDLIGDRTIESLPISFTAVAADVQNEKEIWLNTGSLFDAIRASISLPLFFTPVPYKDGYLVDGGVLNPVPIAPAFGHGADLIVAVNLGGAVETQRSNCPAYDAEDEISNSLQDKVAQFLGGLKDSVLGLNSNHGAYNHGAYNVANESFDAMQSTIARQKLAAYPADVTIEIARNACGTLEFERAAEMIALGREKTRSRFKSLDGCE